MLGNNGWPVGSSSKASLNCMAYLDVIYVAPTDEAFIQRV
jgi:hypothetical protein